MSYKCALCQVLEIARVSLDFPDGPTLLIAMKKVHKLAAATLVHGILNEDEHQDSD